MLFSLPIQASWVPQSNPFTLWRIPCRDLGYAPFSLVCWLVEGTFLASLLLIGELSLQHNDVASCRVVVNVLVCLGVFLCAGDCPPLSDLSLDRFSQSVDLSLLETLVLSTGTSVFVYMCACNIMNVYACCI